MSKQNNVDLRKVIKLLLDKIYNSFFKVHYVKLMFSHKHMTVVFSSLKIYQNTSNVTMLS